MTRVQTGREQTADTRSRTIMWSAKATVLAKLWCAVRASSRLPRASNKGTILSTEEVLRSLFITFFDYSMIDGLGSRSNRWHSPTASI
jgi:hypothetical protein